MQWFYLLLVGKSSNDMPCAKKLTKGMLKKILLIFLLNIFFSNLTLRRANSYRGSKAQSLKMLRIFLSFPYTVLFIFINNN
jgi:hypothetical protein